MGENLSGTGDIQSPKLTGPAEAERVRECFLDDGEIPTWEQATDEFTSLVEYLSAEPIKTYRVLDYATFTREWADAAWYELYSIDRKACQWAESTAMITFSGSYWLNQNRETLLPPITHFKHLQSSKKARQKALSRALSDISKWQSIRVVGGFGYKGYPRVFLGLYLSDEPDSSALQSVLDAHVNNSPIADEQAHQVPEVVSYERSPEHRSQLIHGLGRRIPGLDNYSTDAISDPTSDCTSGIVSETPSRKRMATTIHSGGWRPYTFGKST